MVASLHRTAREQGSVEASTRWRPACAFLDDTVAALMVAPDCPAGLYHLGGNPGLSFFEIATALNRLRGNPWAVVPRTEPGWDQRMVDSRLSICPITDRFPAAE